MYGKHEPTFQTLAMPNIYELELPNVLKPYDPEDLLTHSTDRRYRDVLQHIHTENWEMIEHVVRILDILAGEREGLLVNIASRFIPGEKGDHNRSCFHLRRLKEMIIDYGEGKCPKTRVVIYVSRSTVSLIDSLMRLHTTKHLVRARKKAEALFRIMTYDGGPTMSPKAFGRKVSDLIDGFIADCIANAEELSVHLGSIIEKRREERRAREVGTALTRTDLSSIADKQTAGIVEAIAQTTGAVKATGEKTVAAVDRGAAKIARAVKAAKPRGRRAKFTKSQLEAVRTIHLREAANPEVRSTSVGKHRLEAEFEHAKAELKMHDIPDAEQYRAAIRAYANAKSRSQQRAKK